jgi:hypothetical protein
MTTQTISKTAEILAGMFVENTGRALCDSGDAYGRNWERNQGMTTEMFLEGPKAWMDYGPTLSTFHYLNDRLSYAPAMDRLFNIWLADNEDDRSWLADMEGFAAHMTGDKYINTYNSYNWDTLLDTVVQWTEFEYKDMTYILLQVHGGADVRGGYTKPRVFAVDTWDLWYGDMDRAEIFCNSGKNIPTFEFEVEPVDVMGMTAEMPVMQFKECDFYVSKYGSDMVGRDGDYLSDYDFIWDKEPRCPDCGEILQAMESETY